MEMPVPSLPLFHQQLGSAAQRVGESERSATCDVLAAHYAAGRLSSDEFDQRVALALRSQTLSELWQLTADLPLASASGLPRPLSPRPPSSGPLMSGPQSAGASPALTVLAVLGLIGSGLLAGTMLLVLGAVQPILFVGAVVGGLAAAVGGASLCYLAMTQLRLRHPTRSAACDCGCRN